MDRKQSSSNTSCKSKGGEEPQHTPHRDSFPSSSFHLLQSSLDHVRLPFAYKLHLLLCDMEVNSCEHIISWVEDGNAFKIHDRKKFEELIQPHYFRQSTITSFIRQCYAYGFSKLEFGPGRGSYFHPKFQRSNQSMSLTIQRHSRLNHGLLLQPATRRNITPPCDNNSCCSNHHHNDLACAILPSPPIRCFLSSNRTSPKLNSKSIHVAGELLLVEELFQPLSVDHRLEIFKRDQSVFEPRPIEVMLESPRKNDQWSCSYAFSNQSINQPGTTNVL